MKHYFLLATALFVGATCVNAQEKKEKSEQPSAAATAAFNKSYPGATKVKWDKEGNDFEVNFMNGKKEMSALFTAAGTLKESEEEIVVSSLPVAVTSYISEHFNKAKIKEAAKITSSDGTITYEAEINGADLIFDKDGKFIKEEKRKD